MDGSSSDTQVIEQHGHQESESPPSGSPGRGVVGGASATEPSLRSAMALMMAARAALAKVSVEHVLVALTLAVPAYVFLVYVRRLTYFSMSFDEEHFVWAGWSVLHRRVPYVDFHDYKPPILFLTEALAIRIFGLETYNFRYFFTVLPFLSFFLFHAALLSRKVDKVLSAAAVSFLIFIVCDPRVHDASLNDAESIGLMYLLFAFAAALWNAKSRRALVTVSAVFFTLCALSKEPYAPTVLCGWIICYWLNVRRTKSEMNFGQYLAYSLVGFALVAVPLCIYMVPTGAMRGYIATLGEYASWTKPGNSVCATLGRFTPAPTFFGNVDAAWKRMSAEYINPQWLGPILPFLFGSFFLVASRSIPLSVMSALSVVAGLYAVSAPGCYYQHYYIMAIGSLALLVAAGLDSLGTLLSSAPRRAAMAARAAVCAAGVVAVSPTWVSESERAFAFESFPDIDLARQIQEQSKSTDTIFTTGGPSLYVFSHRRNAVRECVFFDEYLPAKPGTTDREKLRPIYDQLKRNRPKFVYLAPDMANRRTRTVGAAILPFLTDFHYEARSAVLWERPDGQDAEAGSGQRAGSDGAPAAGLTR